MQVNYFEQYKNLLLFATEWRHYEVKSKKLAEKEFNDTIHSKEYVTISCNDNVKKRPVEIYLFLKNSQHITKSQLLKNLLSKIQPGSIVMLVVDQPLKIYGKRTVESNRKLHIFVYLQSTFALCMPNGPLCYPHRIMSKDEVNRLLNCELFCYLSNLPKIFVEDAQCIWIGAEVGDVIEIRFASDASGEVIQHRVVIPRSGRVTTVKEKTEEKTEELLDEAAEELKEEIDNEKTDDLEVDEDNEEDNNEDNEDEPENE